MRLSEHARSRAKEMHVDLQDIALTLLHPEVDYQSLKYGRGQRVALRGLLAVPYIPATRTAITVLWRAEEAR